MKKVTYIISDIDHSIGFELLFEDLKDKFHISVILLGPKESRIATFLREMKIPHQNILCRGKKDWLNAFIKVYRLLKKWKPQILHCHLLQATFIGLVAAKLAGISNRIYTRHHSSEHHIYHPTGVIWDKLCNSWASKVIAISPAVEQILKTNESVPENKIVLIPHGFKINEFQEVSEARKETVRKKYSLTDSGPIIGVISRFVEWKGIQYIIPAFKKLLKDYPGAVLLLLNAKGEYQKQIMNELAGIAVQNKRIVLFEEDIPAVYHNMDLFVHVPINEHCEAFGQIYVEALACGVPAIYTLSGIAPTFIKDHSNALVVDYKNSDQIYETMKEVIVNKQLNGHLRSRGPASISYFSFERYTSDLTALYDALY